MHSDEEEWDETKCKFVDDEACDSDGDDDDNELFENVSVLELGFELNRGSSSSANTRTRLVNKVKRKVTMSIVHHKTAGIWPCRI